MFVVYWRTNEGLQKITAMVYSEICRVGMFKYSTERYVVDTKDTMLLTIGVWTCVCVHCADEAINQNQHLIKAWQKILVREKMILYINTYCIIHISPSSNTPICTKCSVYHHPCSPLRKREWFLYLYEALGPESSEIGQFLENVDSKHSLKHFPATFSKVVTTSG